LIFQFLGWHGNPPTSAKSTSRVRAGCPAPEQKVFRKSFGVDLGYYFLNNLVPKALLIFPMAWFAWGLHSIVPSGLHSWVAAMPLWMRLAAALVVGEVGYYWGHRWTHEIPLLWRFHSIHHSAEQID
jgi:sterol desaturase/sphingolipid hydroxylase (fatty acid hydroxylase superfamily)